MSRTRSITDAAILDAATEIITAKGIGSLTFASLSAHTSLAPPTLVQRFHTKENLLFCVAKHCLADTSSAFAKAQAQHKSPTTALLHAFGLLAASIKSAGHFAHGLALLQLALQDPHLHTLLRDNARMTKTRITKLLDDAVVVHEIIACDTDALAESLQAAYEGATTTWAIYQQGSAAEWTINQLEQVIKPYRKQ